MKTAKLLVMVATPDDLKGHASDVASCKVPQDEAMSLAREIDAFGSRGAGVYLPCFDLKEGYRLVAGHGVVIEYESGRRRTVRHP